MSKLNADRGPHSPPSHISKDRASDNNPLMERDQLKQNIPSSDTVTPPETTKPEAQRQENVSSDTTQQETIEAMKHEEEEGTDSESEAGIAYEERLHRRPLEIRKKKSRKRLFQATHFLRLLEDRMVSMEKELIDLRKQLQAQTDVDDQVMTSKSTSAGSTKGSWKLQEQVQEAKGNGQDSDNLADHYKLPDGPNLKVDLRDWKEFARGDPSGACVVEVLNGDIGAGKNRMATAVLRRSLKQLAQNISPELGTLPSVADVQVKLPLRIWIHSKHIINVLERVTLHKTRYEDVILLAPYKTLVLHDSDIRTELNKLETLFPDPPDQVPLIPAAEASAPQPLTDEPLAQPFRKIKKVKQEPIVHKAFTKEEFREGRLAVTHVRLLVQFMDNHLKNFVNFRRRLAEGNVTTFAFAHLFLMFSPGFTVFSRDRRQAFEVFSVSGGLPLDKIKATAEDRDAAHPRGLYSYNTHDITSPFIIDCYRFDFDGVSYGPVQESFAVPFFNGEKPISSLPVVPLNCLKGGGALKEEMMQNGQKFLDLFQDCKKFAHKVYEGLGKNIKGDIEEIDSQVIVDFASAFQKNPEWKPRLGLRGPSERDPREMTDCSTDVSHFEDELQICIMCELDRFWPDEQIVHLRCNEYVVSIRDEISITQDEKEMRSREEQLLLLPPTVYGFALRGRKWVALDMNNIHDIVHPEEGFEDLVINPDHKLMVQALVRTHSRVTKKGGKSVPGTGAAYYQSDLVGGKGRGRILLLHGPPGVGKTSTAECVADLTGRPLFQITCGDIGTEPAEVEEKLDENFQLAHRWDCVLLLDEADVFLQERDRVNLKRNSLVSVFLRVLEYYPGLLFLTTNREGILDEAFKSRIHITLHYERPDLESWLQIWTNNIKRAKKHYKMNEKKIIKWAEKEFFQLKWNGRQIRNAFQAAIALAEYSVQDQNLSSTRDVRSEPIASKVVELKIKHFEQVAKVSMGFDAYIDSIYGYDTLDDRVKRGYLRNDKFSSAGWQNNNNFANPSNMMGPGFQGFGNQPNFMNMNQGSMSGPNMQQSQRATGRSNGRMQGMYAAGGPGGGQQASTNQVQPNQQGGFHKKTASHGDDSSESEDSDE